MTKSEILALLESQKPSNINAVKSLTQDQFISYLMECSNALLEQNDAYQTEPNELNRSRHKDVMEMDMDENSAEGLPSIIRKDVEDGKKSGTGFDKSGKKDKKGSSDNKLKYATDLGVKVIEYNDAFKKMPPEQLNEVSDLFNPDEMQYIQQAQKSDWKRVNRLKIYVRANELDKPRNATQLYDVYNPQAPNKQTDKIQCGFIDNLYMRNDDGGKDKPIIMPKSGIKYVPMTPTKDTQRIMILPLNTRHMSRARFAMIFKIPGEEGTWIAPLSGERLMFYFKATR